MKTKLFYGIFIVLSMWGLYSCKQAEKPIKFAIVSDLHAPDLPDGRERMQAVVDAANAENVDFLIQLGDFIRRKYGISIKEKSIMFWEITTWINIPKKSLLPDSACRAVIILLTRVISILLCLTEIICLMRGNIFLIIKPIIM